MGMAEQGSMSLRKFFIAACLAIASLALGGCELARGLGFGPQVDLATAVGRTIYAKSADTYCLTEGPKLEARKAGLRAINAQTVYATVYPLDCAGIGRIGAPDFTIDPLTGVPTGLTPETKSASP